VLEKMEIILIARCIFRLLIADSRRSDLTEPSPHQKAMAELLGTDLINIPD